MNRVFLGRPSHWIGLIAAFGCLAVLGLYHLHTSQYNLFALAAFMIGLALVLLVVLPHTRGEQVTRDPIEIPPDDHETFIDD
jgi:uncharacterized membrane protein